MKKTLFTYFLPFLSCLANTGVEEMLFCTKNLEASRSTGNAVPAAGKLPLVSRGGQMDAYNSLADRSGSFVDLRHCFLAFGRVSKLDNERIALSNVMTLGYGQLPESHRAPGQRSGAVYSEQWAGEEVVACVPILSEISSDALIDLYAQAMKKMVKSADTEDYDAYEHNCCTVACTAATFIGANLTAVDPSSFNFHGMGVEWRPSDYSPNTLSNKASNFLMRPINFSKIVVADASASVTDAPMSLADNFMDTLTSTLSANPEQIEALKSKSKKQEKQEPGTDLGQDL